MSRLSRIVLGKQVRTANPIAMRSKTASRAAIHTPLGFIALQAPGPVQQRARTGLAGRGFFDQGNGNPSCRRLVGDVRSLPSVRPQANLLLALRIQSLPIRHVSYISNDERADLALPRPVHHRAADLVFHIAGAALLLRQETTLAPLEATKGARPSPFARLFRTQLGETLGGVLRIGTQRAAGEDDGFLAIREGSRMNLPQVHRCGVGPLRCGCWLRAIFNGHMPGIVPGGPVPHQTHFQESSRRQREQIGGQPDLDGIRPT